jgi:Rrf2 family transcriptional regulator, iron-sulfur cluster assembly transcription factor
MIYSRSSEYAIRASLHLAQVPPGQCAMAKDIAKDEEIPAHFLAKILQQLARKGLLKSTKGPTGGFCMQLKASDIRLIDIVDAVDGLSDYGKCIAGFPECSDKMGCPLHDGWTALHSRIMDYLRRNTIGSLVKKLEAQQRNSRPAPGRRSKKSPESKKALRPSL